MGKCSSQNQLSLRRRSHIASSFISEIKPAQLSTIAQQQQTPPAAVPSSSLSPSSQHIAKACALGKHEKLLLVDLPVAVSVDFVEKHLQSFRRQPPLPRRAQRRGRRWGGGDGYRRRRRTSRSRRSRWRSIIRSGWISIG